MLKTSKLLGAILLVSGTSIGAGMLAFPVTTAEYGFFPSLILFIICWAFMTFAALLMLETNLMLAPDTNMISMAKATLGNLGQIITWLTYLLLLYSLMAAYLSGMDALLLDFISRFLHVKFSKWAGSAILIVIFGMIIYLGALTIDHLNRFLISGLIIAYLCLIILITPHIQAHYLTQINFHHFGFALPILVTSFGYQIIIPSLRVYLDSDVKQLKKAILLGSIVPLFVYLIWEISIIGVLPVQGKYGLLAILAQGQPAVGLTIALKELLNNPWIAIIAKYFGFFAIATSFIGVSFCLFDFLSDGLRIRKTKLGRLSTASITFIPPLIYTLIYPRGFIVALGYAGAFVAILLCIMPAAMAYSGRYRKKMASAYQAKGGILSLGLLILFSIIIIMFELLK